MPNFKTLDEYGKKRDFRRTPEPPPGKLEGRPGAPAFVVHRHEARRLHYDLRLEMEGVLKSWAVPRGFSYVPSVKRLAVRTEDHPLEYEHFEGVIPKDAYGAGTMTIWDRGSYRLAKGQAGPAAIEE
ncbi:MAG: DNA polymerase ligase N-terminal domain-containing protein, partial [Acidobacteriota bacterium]